MREPGLAAPAGASGPSLPEHVRSFLDATRDAAFPASALQDEDVACEWLARARRRKPARTHVEPVREVREGRVPGGPAVRLYIPRLGRPLPTLLFFHGGGWVLGDLDSNDAICRRLANQGEVLVVSVDYRLAPEYPFPAALDDVVAAYAWVRAGIDRFGGDPARIAVAGSSAGANLAAALTLRLRDVGSEQPSLQMLLYPPLEARADSPSHRRNATGYSLHHDQMRWFWQAYAPGSPDQPLVSPAYCVDLGGLAPAYVVTAEFDPLHDEGCAYADRLKMAGVPVELDDVAAQIHGFLNLVGAWPEADAAAARAAKALRARFEDGATISAY